MIRVAVAGLYHESNTYSPIETRASDFRVHAGADLVAFRAGSATFLGGIVDAVRAAGAELVPLVDLAAEPSAPVSAEGHAELKGRVLHALRHAGPVDVVCLALHGAALAEGTEHLEADVCGAVRALVGPEVLVGVTVDLHANLGEAELVGVDLLLSGQRYPHVDEALIGARLVTLLLAQHAGHPPLRQAVVRLPLLPADRMATDREGYPGRRALELARAAEAAPGVVHATFLHGFPWADRERAGSSVLVVTEHDVDPVGVAEALADAVWELRESMRCTMLGVDDALAFARRTPGAVVLADFADNPGGGAPGDATHLLRALLEAPDLRPAAVGVLFDPGAVAAATAAGEGAWLELELGGRHELGGGPVGLRARVGRLVDAPFRWDGGVHSGLDVDHGGLVRLDADGLAVLVAARRFQTFDPVPFTTVGIDVGRQRVVAVKSANHLRAAFTPLASALEAVASPGVVTPMLDTLPREHGLESFPLAERASRT
jgi:toxic protein SymE